MASMEAEEDPGTERSTLVDLPPADCEEVPKRYLLSSKWARRVAAASALALVALVLLPWACAIDTGSLRFVEGVGPRAWQVLRSELTTSKELQTVGLAHISRAAGDVLCVIDVAQATGWVLTTGSFVKFVTVACDYDRIRRVNKREVLNDEKERCTVGVLGILLSLELFMGVTASSVSTCSGSLNVPSNCAANIGAFTGGITVLMQTTLGADLNCAKGVKQGKRTPQEKIDAVIAKKEAQIQNAKDSAARSVNKWLINAGIDVEKLPAPPAVPTHTVYNAINRCVAQVQFGATFLMRFAIILADSTIHCHPGVVGQEGRVCAIDITGMMATLSLSIRFFSLVSNSCINIVGRADGNANCVASVAGITGATMASTSSGMNLEAACKTAFGDWNPDQWPSGSNEIPVEDGNVILPDV